MNLNNIVTPNWKKDPIMTVTIHSTDAELTAAIKHNSSLDAQHIAHAGALYPKAAFHPGVGIMARLLWTRFQTEYRQQQPGTAKRLRIALEADGAMNEIVGMPELERAIFDRNMNAAVREDGIPSDATSQAVMRRHPALKLLLERHLAPHEMAAQAQAMLAQKSAEQARIKTEEATAGLPRALVEDLETQGVTFELIDGGKSFQATPAAKIDGGILAKLRDHRDSVLAILQQRVVDNVAVVI